MTEQSERGRVPSSARVRWLRQRLLQRKDVVGSREAGARYYERRGESSMPTARRVPKAPVAAAALLDSPRSGGLDGAATTTELTR